MVPQLTSAKTSARPALVQNGVVSYQLSSHDLTYWYSFFLSHIKSLVYERLVTSAEDLVSHLSIAGEYVLKMPDVFAHGCLFIIDLYNMKLFITNGGRPIEHLS